MFNKFIGWFLDKAYRYHKNQSYYYLDKANDLYQAGQFDKDVKYYAKYDYHNECCRKIDTIVYTMNDAFGD